MVFIRCHWIKILAAGLEAGGERLLKKTLSYFTVAICLPGICKIHEPHRPLLIS